MTTFRVAQINQNGIDICLVLVDPSFAQKQPADQIRETQKMQREATDQGLKGRIIPVWDASGSNVHFFAPAQWKEFFRSVDLTFLTKNFNGSLEHSE